MAPEFQSLAVAGLGYGEALWQHFRNGLAHGFAVCHGGFEGAANEPYFLVRNIAGHDCLEVNPTRFLMDYVAGFERYLVDLRAANPAASLALDFHRVFEDVFIDGN